jgi:hypothetical protein
LVGWLSNTTFGDGDTKQAAFGNGQTKQAICRFLFKFTSRI